MRAKLDPSLDARVAWGQYGWWQGNEDLGLPAFDALADTGSNFNRLVTDDVGDPVSGSTGLRSSMCESSPSTTLRNTAGSDGVNLRLPRAAMESRDIVSLVLKPRDGEPLPAFRGGQHVTARLEGPNGEPIVRCYSLSRSTHGEDYRISVKLTRAADGGRGKMSALLHGAAPGRGRTVALRAPKGDFHLGSLVEFGSPGDRLHSRRHRRHARALHAARIEGVGVEGACAAAVRRSIWRGSCVSGRDRELADDLSALKVTTFFSGEKGRKNSSAERSGRIAIDDVLAAADENSPILSLRAAGYDRRARAAAGKGRNCGRSFAFGGVRSLQPTCWTARSWPTGSALEAVCPHFHLGAGTWVASRCDRTGGESKPRADVGPGNARAARCDELTGPWFILLAP